MPDPLAEYQTFIDELTGWPRASAAARWVNEWDTPAEKRTWQVPLGHPLHFIVPALDAGQHTALAELLQQERDAGIHAVLACFTGEVNLRGLRLSRNGVDFPIEPFGAEMYYDWVARCAGDPWPERAGADE